MSEQAKDTAFGLVLAAVGIGAIALINTTKGERAIAGTDVMSFSTLPTIYGSLLAVLSLLYVLGALRGGGAAKAGAANPEAKAPARERAIVAIRIAGVLAALIAYAVLLEYLNFLVLTTAFLAAMFVLFGQRPYWKVGLVSAAGGAGLYGLFIVALDLPI